MPSFKMIIYRPKLKEQMQYCVDHPEEISKLAKVKAQVSEVKGVMMENIEKVLDRGEKIELLVDKTENLRSQITILSIPSITHTPKGTRFQDTRNNNEEEDVVAEHEDQAYSFGDYYCLDSDHSFVSVWWFQVSLVRFLILLGWMLIENCGTFVALVWQFIIILFFFYCDVFRSIFYVS
ncbi:hypothetical protein H5410_047253 [Solanum commersonii]|uniref:V-SNARE coiled-coil homology domain-containing protein n=1 Tax=Solanum commersonii TaxID=4109 RepID=A0A9J5XEL6_SOLCO|nr:hypothetical protein H5410_047253 [Solanum commersonii]